MQKTRFFLYLSKVHLLSFAYIHRALQNDEIKDLWSAISNNNRFIGMFLDRGAATYYGKIEENINS